MSRVDSMTIKQMKDRAITHGLKKVFEDPHKEVFGSPTIEDLKSRASTHTLVDRFESLDMQQSSARPSLDGTRKSILENSQKRAVFEAFESVDAKDSEFSLAQGKRLQLRANIRKLIEEGKSDDDIVEALLGDGYTRKMIKRLSNRIRNGLENPNDLDLEFGKLSAMLEYWRNLGKSEDEIIKLSMKRGYTRKSIDDALGSEENSRGILKEMRTAIEEALQRGESDEDIVKDLVGKGHNEALVFWYIRQIREGFSGRRDSNPVNSPKLPISPNSLRDSVSRWRAEGKTDKDINNLVMKNYMHRHLLTSGDNYSEALIEAILRYVDEGLDDDEIIKRCISDGFSLAEIQRVLESLRQALAEMYENDTYSLSGGSDHKDSHKHHSSLNKHHSSFVKIDITDESINENKPLLGDGGTVHNDYALMEEPDSSSCIEWNLRTVLILLFIIGIIVALIFVILRVKE